ncbi:MAG: hypothetical protein ACKVG9_07515 [Rhodospirillales bacterium]
MVDATRLVFAGPAFAGLVFAEMNNKESVAKNPVESPSLEGFVHSGIR